MSNVTVIDKLPLFAIMSRAALNNALREAARDGLIDAKEHAPFSKGDLRGVTDVHEFKLLTWRISFWMEYARFQEFGGDSKRQVRNYSTAGTGAHFLKNAGDKQREKLRMNFAKHSRTIKL